MGGIPSSASDDAVVGIVAGSYACSATLIAPDVIVTALHCVTDFNTTATFECNADGSLTSDSTGGALGPTIDPSRISVAYGATPAAGAVKIHGKAIYGTNSPEICRDDIAVVVLDGDVPIGDAPLAKLRFSRSTKDGDAVRVIGYGQTDMTTNPGRVERDDLSILGVGSPNSVIRGDPGVAPRTVMIGEGPCHGDSGGPLLSEDTGADLGVCSVLTTSTCEGPDVRNVYTQIAPYEDLIRMALGTVGEEPLVEATPETGEAGEGGATGQAGESSSGPTPGDAGAAPESMGGTGAAGGGGSGAVAGSAVGTTGGDTAMGDDTTEAGSDGVDGIGSGSRRDPSCTCRTAPTHVGAPWSLVGFSLVTLSFLRRRRRS